MKFVIVTVLSLLCLSSACDNHGHHSHSHEPEEDSTANSAHRRLGQPESVTNRPDAQAFKASGDHCGTPAPTDEEKKETGQKVAEWVQQRNRGEWVQQNHAHGNKRQLKTSNYMNYTINTIVHCISDEIPVALNSIDSIEVNATLFYGVAI